jgi:DNA polymerase-3 subunit gamma/tau
VIAHAALGTPGRWKVYIVDEVHMLSNAAANALLKTLEEPPGHVIFVLATTDPQKVPPTIRSRTQHFEFRLLGTDTLAGLLHDVNDAAGLSLGDDALSVAVRRGRGSARDALSALDQVAASGSAEDARPELAEVVESLGAEDAGRALVALAALHGAGWGPQQLAAELVDDIRQAFLAALAPELSTAGAPRFSAHADQLGLARLVRSMEVLGRAQVDMRDAPDPRVVLEVALVRLARPELDDSAAALGDRLSRVERALAAPASAAPAAPAPPGGALPERDLLVQAWGDHVLRRLPARAKALYSAGRYVSVEDGAAVFALPNAAHRDRCQDVCPIVEKALAAHFGVPVPLRLVVDDGAPAADPSPVLVDDGLGAEARLLEAFPGAEEVPG